MPKDPSDISSNDAVREMYDSTAVCDIRKLEMLADHSAAAVISHFGFHHLDLSGVSDACKEWHRVLVDGGQLVLAAWEGSGAIDYGEHSDK